MTEKQIMEAAIQAGFHAAAIIDTSEIVFDPAFRPLCEENLCGKYGVNYACPPDCGSPEEMKRRVLAHKKAVVLQSMWEIYDFQDEAAVKNAKQCHNACALQLADELRKENMNGFLIGASGCQLCKVCAIVDGQPCRFPDQKYSCMSAYCIYVKKLADCCNMAYAYEDGLLPFFGMYVFD